jgi:hypothetical protein
MAKDEHLCALTHQDNKTQFAIDFFHSDAKISRAYGQNKQAQRSCPRFT